MNETCCWTVWLQTANLVRCSPASDSHYRMSLAAPRGPGRILIDHGRRLAPWRELGYGHGGDLVGKTAMWSPRPGDTALATQRRKERRPLKEPNRRVAAKVYVKACEKIGEPAPQSTRNLVKAS